MRSLWGKSAPARLRDHFITSRPGTPGFINPAIPAAQYDAKRDMYRDDHDGQKRDVPLSSDAKS